jgi:hypothetical protein
MRHRRAEWLPSKRHFNHRNLSSILPSRVSIIVAMRAAKPAIATVGSTELASASAASISSVASTAVSTSPTTTIASSTAAELAPDPAA